MHELRTRSDIEDKARLARAFCDEHELRIEKALLAYGDSMSDVPLFDTFGYRIAINADHHLADLSDIDVCSDDLRDAYHHHARRFKDRPQ